MIEPGRSSRERRVHERFPFSGQLEVCQRRGGRTPSGVDVQLVARVMAVDISVRGFGFRTALPLSVGDFIRVSLSDIDGTRGMGAESPMSPSPDGEDSEVEIVAIVRHAHRDGHEYVIGAERDDA